MYKLKLIPLICLTFLTTSLSAFSTTHPVTGDQVVLWQNWGSSGFEILASVQIGGVYSTPLNIADPLTNPRVAFASINSSDQIVAIWRGYDPTLGSATLYAATYASGVWSLPVTISDPSMEDVQDEYFVRVTDSGVMVVTWQSYQFLTGMIVMRTVYCPTFATWTTPITL